MIVEDRRELDALVPSPNIEVVEYDRVYDSYDRLQSFVKRINNCKLKVENSQLRLILLCTTGCLEFMYEL